MAARLLFFDIETYRTRNEAVIARIRQEAIDKEPPKTAAKDVKLTWNSMEEREERFAEALDKTAVDPLLAEVLCVCVALDKKPVWRFGLNEQEPTEHDILTRLRFDLEESIGPETIWIGHNIAGFDLPILLNRWRRYNIAPPTHFPAFNDGRWHGRVYDTMKRAPAKTPFVSMDALCEAYGVPLKDTLWKGLPMHGGRVAEAYHAEAYDTILDYCTEDVEATRRLYHAMTAGDMWGTYTRTDEIKAQIAEIEQSDELTEGQRALAQKQVLITAGLWPR